MRGSNEWKTILMVSFYNYQSVNHTNYNFAFSYDSELEMKSKMAMLFASDIGLEILVSFPKWHVDGFFKNVQYYFTKY
jgi:hypothetical protein